MPLTQTGEAEQVGSDDGSFEQQPGEHSSVRCTLQRKRDSLFTAVAVPPSRQLQQPAGTAMQSASVSQSTRSGSTEAGIWGVADEDVGASEPQAANSTAAKMMTKRRT